MKFNWKKNANSTIRTCEYDGKILEYSYEKGDYCAPIDMYL